MPKPVIAFLLAIFFAEAQDPAPKMKWYKGNTHTHTLNTDGDSVPADVVRWYREQKYNFLVLSDHDSITEVAALNQTYGAPEPPDGERPRAVGHTPFLLIPGEEVTGALDGKAIHLTAINVRRVVTPRTGGTVLETLQRNVDAIRETGGVPIINHPNFLWSLTAAELKAVRNARMVELYNGHPTVNNLGGGGVPSVEQMWDEALSAGVVMWGVAADDAHYFRQPWSSHLALPGRGWIMVRAPRLTAEAIVDAMERGDFYASTGVELAEYQAGEKAVTIAIKETRRTAKYRVQFIGRGGRVLKETYDNPAVYAIRGDEGYVRARITDSNGLTAWTQPMFVRR
jgi:predicted metal-dependent phosphoesterase TrpH